VKIKKFFYGTLATAFALCLAGADIASAQYGPCGRGQGGGRGAFVQADPSQVTSQNYQQGQGCGRGGQRQRRRDGSCLNNLNSQAPAAIPVPAPAN
jgi:hypothetical protein